MILSADNWSAHTVLYLPPFPPGIDWNCTRDEISDFAFLQHPTPSPCCEPPILLVPASLLISSSFPCNRSFGDRKNSSFLFRLNCLLCLINSSIVISIFIGQDNTHIQEFSFWQWLYSTVYSSQSIYWLACVIYSTHPSKASLSPPFSRVFWGKFYSIHPATIFSHFFPGWLCPFLHNSNSCIIFTCKCYFLSCQWAVDRHLSQVLKSFIFICSVSDSFWPHGL